MRVRAVAIPESDKAALFSDLQHYLRELMQYGTFSPVNGIFPYRRLDAYWGSPDRWPFWAEANGRSAGFALVRRRDDGCMEMAEFYIHPAHRRSGVGLAFARSLLGMFSGTWIISEYRVNVAAVAFWRRVVEPFPFAEREYEGDEHVPRLEQKVTVPAS
jgi:predicted acetyltransferase